MNLESVIKNLSRQEKISILNILGEDIYLDALTQDKDTTLCLYKKERNSRYSESHGFWLRYSHSKEIGKTDVLADDHETAIINRKRLLVLLQENTNYSSITKLLPSDFYVNADKFFDKELFFDVLESMGVVWKGLEPLRYYTPQVTVKYYRVTNGLLTYGSVSEPPRNKNMSLLFSKLPERWFVLLDDIDIDKFDAYCKKRNITFSDKTGVRESLKSKSSRSFLVKYNTVTHPYRLVFSSDPEGENITHLFLKDTCKSNDTITDIDNMSHVLIIEDKEYVESDTAIEPGDILTTYKKAKAYTFIAMDGFNYIVKTSKGGLLTIDNPIKLVPSSVLHYAAIELEDGSVSLTSVHSSKHSLDSLLKSQLKYLKYKKVTYLTYERG